MLFKIFSLHQAAKAWKNDPREEAVGVAKGAIIGYLLTTFIVTFLILGLLGVLAFSSWLGGPYGVAKVLFFIVVIPLSLALIALQKIVSTLRRMIHQVGRDKPRPKESGVIDVTIDEKDA